MELELGLALPVSAYFPNKNTLDLKTSTAAIIEDAGLAMEFKNLIIRQKRSFAKAFDQEFDDETKTLSLLVWHGRRPNNDDNDDHDDDVGFKRKPFTTTAKKDEDETEIVGWPPIKSWRKKLLDGIGGHHERIINVVDHQNQRANNNINNNNNNNNNGAITRKSIFVKVKMEGVVIGRKIDLKLFDSYQGLTNTLLNMFAKYGKVQGENDDEDDDGANYILSYLDKEGDWLLAGDVPWQMFIESVQRMELVKQSS